MRSRLLAGILLYAIGAAAFVGLDPLSSEKPTAPLTCAPEARIQAPSLNPGEEAAREARCGETLADMERELTEPSDAMLRRQLFGAGTRLTPARYLARAAAQAEALGEATAAADPVAAGEPWRFVGPTNIGGRVLDVVVDPTTPNAVYAATATGGVWRSTDSGTTFKPAWPAEQTQAIGALAATPDGTLFAGTGEAGPGGGSITYGGAGVFRSEDKGTTWERVGLDNSGRIGRIVVDPSDPSRIWVAATGPLFRAGGDRGVYLSEDGGTTFRRVLAPANATTGAVDLAVDPKVPTTVYAATWDHLRQPSGRRYEGPGSGIYRSTDSGRTWTRIGGPLLTDNPALGRIGLAVAGDRTVYAITSLNQGRHAFFRSTDQGATFLPGSADAALLQTAASFSWWFGRVWVDPKNPQHVFVAGLNLVESTNGGQSFRNVGGVHADQHAMAWDPAVADRVYLGNDGGVYRSTNNGSTWAFARSQPWSQLYGLDVYNQDDSKIVAGLQDNGSNRSWGPNGTWVGYHGGDGERTLIKPTSTPVTSPGKLVIYGCAQYGNCVRSDNGGSSTTPLGPQVSGRYNWFTPIEFDPKDPNTIYSGGDVLNRSTDQGNTFTPISPILSRDVTSDTNPDYSDYGTITTIAPAGKATGVIYAGTDDGLLWVTKDDGATWTQATDPDLPKAWITRVEVDPADPRHALVTYSGMRSGDRPAFLLETKDGGASWTPIGQGLPEAPLNDVNLVGSTIVVGGEVGVFFRRSAQEGWLRLGSGLPLAPVHELRHHQKTDQLFVATFGRGVWAVPAGVLKTPG